MAATRARALSIALAALLLASGGPARADEPVTEVDRRGALALANSLGPADVQQGLKDIGEVNVRTLDLWNVAGPGLTREFASRFGTSEADGSGKGYHKITIGGVPPDLASLGWTFLGAEKDPAFEIWVKRVDRSDSERYNEFALRGRVGRVVLAVVQRLPKADSDAEARRRLTDRFHRLFDAADKAGLFARVRTTVFPAAGGSGTPLDEGAVPIFALPRGGRRIVLALETYDGGGSPLEASEYRLALSGTLAEFVTVENETLVPGKSAYVLPSSGFRRDVTLVLPPPSPAVRAKLAAGAAGGASAPSIGVSVDATLKGSPAERIDAKGTGRARFATWDVVVSAFFVAPRTGAESPGYHVPSATPGLEGTWISVANDVRPRPKMVYAGHERVYSGWRLVTEGAGRDFVGHFLEKEADRLVSVEQGGDLNVYLVLDIAAPLEDGERRARIRDHFQVLETRITSHLASADPAGARNAADEGPEGPPLLATGGSNDLTGPTLVVPDGSPLEVVTTVSGAKPGVHELRLRARIGGRFDPHEEMDVWEVVGCIRFSVVERDGTPLEWKDTGYRQKG